MTTETRWHDICPIEELQDDLGLCALLDDAPVAVFRPGGQDRIFAIGNIDPFSRASVLSRGITGDLKGRLVVASPVYKQHFDLATGDCVEDATVSVPVYPVRISGNILQVGTNN
ncbi:MAG: nitrite reductase small subunit NirD [Gammaproteobacteria bacterium]|nr:nitrite reductase small subunit NirD [Gammaproteobacteria bacterium]